MTGVEAIRALAVARQSASFAVKLIDSVITPMPSGQPPSEVYITPTLGKILVELAAATEAIEELCKDEVM